jgi:hypothetical protein
MGRGGFSGEKKLQVIAEVATHLKSFNVLIIR